MDDSAVYALSTLPAADLKRHQFRHIMHSERLYVSHSEQRLLPQQCSFLLFRNHDLTTTGRIRPCLTSLLNKSSRYPTSFLYLHVSVRLGMNSASLGHHLSSLLLHLSNLISHCILGVTGKGKRSHWAASKVRASGRLDSLLHY